jgi:hypothetical protein
VVEEVHTALAMEELEVLGVVHLVLLLVQQVITELQILEVEVVERLLLVHTQGAQVVQA